MAWARNVTYLCYIWLKQKWRNYQHIGIPEQKKQATISYISGWKPIIVECSHLNSPEVCTQDFHLLDAIDSDELAELLVFFSN